MKALASRSGATLRRARLPFWPPWFLVSNLFHAEFLYGNPIQSSHLRDRADFHFSSLLWRFCFINFLM